MGLLDGIQKKQIDFLKRENALLRADNERLATDNKNLGGWGTTIDRLLLQLVDGQGQITAALAVQRGMLKQMPTREQFNEGMNQLKQAITDAANRVATDLQALRDQIANGAAVTDQDLADIQTDVRALSQIDAPSAP